MCISFIPDPDLLPEVLGHGSATPKTNRRTPVRPTSSYRNKRKLSLTGYKNKSKNRRVRYSSQDVGDPVYKMRSQYKMKSLTIGTNNVHLPYAE